MAICCSVWVADMDIDMMSSPCSMGDWCEGDSILGEEEAEEEG